MRAATAEKYRSASRKRVPEKAWTDDSLTAWRRYWKTVVELSMTISSPPSSRSMTSARSWITE